MKKENLFSFMRQVTAELQGRGNLGTAHVYKSTLNAILTFQGSEKLMFRQLTSEWVKRFEISLRERGCSWNTVSTYLRTLRAVYNRAVDRRKAVYVPHLFRSVYTGTRADRQRALDGEDMRKVFTRLPQSRIPPMVEKARDWFILMFLLRGLPFVDLAYLRKNDLQGNVITYRRRKTGRSLSVTLTPEAMSLLQKHMNRNSESPYLFPILRSKEGTEEAYREYQSALRRFNNDLKSLSRKLRISSSVTSYTLRHSWATTAKYRGVPIEMISESLGHKSIKTTQIYLKGFELEERTKVNKLNYSYVCSFKMF